MTKIISLVIIQAIFSFTFFPVSYSDNNLIQTTCQKTPFANLCVTTLRSDPRSGNADVAGLGHIMADAVNTKATATLNQITRLLKSAQDPRLQKALQGCVDSYKTITQADIPVAIEAIVKGNPKFAVEYATDAANEADRCEKSFVNPPTSPISDENKNVHDLLTVLQSIASLLL